MITTYGFSIATAKNPRLSRQVIDEVLSWLNHKYPPETRTKLTQIDVRNHGDDPNFRVSVLEKDAQHPETAVEVIVTLQQGKTELFFETRRMLRPTAVALYPRRTTDLPGIDLANLINTVIRIFRVRDAEQLVTGEVIEIDDQLGAQSLEAFCQAPSRKLPVVIESRLGKPVMVTTKNIANQLAGIAHFAHIKSQVGEDEFNIAYGERILSSRWLMVFWPKPTKPQAYYDSNDLKLVGDLISASVGALPKVVVDPPPKKRTPGLLSEDRPALQESGSLNELQDKFQHLTHEIKHLEDENKDLRDENTGLQENARLTDLISAQKTKERDDVLEQFVTFLTLKDQNDISLEKAKDAVAKAKKVLKDLVFHERALQSATDSHLMNGKRIFTKLVELNNLAARLHRGDIAPHMFSFTCDSQISNFAASISDEAIHRYSMDYTIEWKNELVLAKPHIRVGDARIHFYHDMKSNEIVIAYVGRHLRDKSTN